MHNSVFYAFWAVFGFINRLMAGDISKPRRISNASVWGHHICDCGAVCEIW